MSRIFAAGVALAAAAALLAVPGQASRSARPGFTAQPEVPIGQAVVGSTLLLGNGSPVCEPACGPESNRGPEPDRVGTFYQVIRCLSNDGGGFDGPPGGLPDTSRPCSQRPVDVFAKRRSRENTYTVQPADVGYRLQLEVFLVNYDSDALGGNAHYAEAHAYSAPTAIVTGPAQPPPPPPPPPSSQPDRCAGALPGVPRAKCELQRAIALLRAAGIAWPALKATPLWHAYHDDLGGT